MKIPKMTMNNSKFSGGLSYSKYLFNQERT